MICVQTTRVLYFHLIICYHDELLSTQTDDDELQHEFEEISDGDAPALHLQEGVKWGRSSFSHFTDAIG